MNDPAYRSSLDLPPLSLLAGVIYSFFSGLKPKFGRPSRKIPVGPALLYLFAQWLVLVAHHTHTHTHLCTHRMLSVLISAAFRTAVECKKPTSDPSTARLLPSHHHQFNQQDNPHPSINSFPLQLRRTLLSVGVCPNYSFDLSTYLCTKNTKRMRPSGHFSRFFLTLRIH